MQAWNSSLSGLNFTDRSMPNPYSVDLRWRIIWLYLARKLSSLQIAALLNVSERTVRRYVALFYRTGDVKPRQRKNGPQRLLGEFEQLILLRLILVFIYMS